MTNEEAIEESMTGGIITEHRVAGANAFGVLVAMSDPNVFELYADGTLTLRFQDGPPLGVVRNGWTNEELIAAILHRLRSFNQGSFACKENSCAITKLEEALMWLQKRTMRRIAEGVEGTLNPGPGGKESCVTFERTGPGTITMTGNLSAKNVRISA